MRRLYLLTRDLHLYLGLFISPFVLLFSVSVFYLVHGMPPRAPGTGEAAARVVSGIDVPAGLATLQGRARVDAVRPLLARLGVPGEVDFIRHVAAEHRLVVPVRRPGRETIVTIDYRLGTATISARGHSAAEAIVYLHKSPGPHNADVRGNDSLVRSWRVAADGTVYAFVFVTLSGVYLWAALKAERRTGALLLAAGAATFFGLVYAIAA